MKSNYEKKPGFKVAGISTEIKEDDDYKKLWDELFKKSSREELKALGNQMSYALKEFNAINQKYNYTVGFDVEDEKKAKDLDLFIKPVKEADYLVIDVDGDPETEFPIIYDYIYKEYFPNRKYFHAISPDVEVYYPDGKIELWIPLMENPHKD